MWATLLFVAAICFCIYFIYQTKVDPRKDIKLQYIGGHPDLKGPRRISIEDSEDSISIDWLSIKKRDIKDIKLVPRSAVGGALAGAALGAIVAGPVGALIGGAAASGSPGANNVIQLSIVENGINYEMFFADADIINKYPLVQRLIIN